MGPEMSKLLTKLNMKRSVDSVTEETSLISLIIFGCNSLVTGDCPLKGENVKAIYIPT